MTGWIDVLAFIFRADIYIYICVLSPALWRNIRLGNIQKNIADNFLTSIPRPLLYKATATRIGMARIMAKARQLLLYKVAAALTLLIKEVTCAVWCLLDAKAEQARKKEADN